MYVDRKSFISKMDGLYLNPSQIVSFMMVFAPWTIFFLLVASVYYLLFSVLLSSQDHI